MELLFNQVIAYLATLGYGHLPEMGEGANFSKSGKKLYAFRIVEAGAFSALFKKIEIVVDCQEGEGCFWGNISYQYDHVGTGSNGKTIGSWKVQNGELRVGLGDGTKYKFEIEKNVSALH